MSGPTKQPKGPEALVTFSYDSEMLLSKSIIINHVHEEKTWFLMEKNKYRKQGHEQSHGYRAPRSKKATSHRPLFHQTNWVPQLGALFNPFLGGGFPY